MMNYFIFQLRVVVIAVLVIVLGGCGSTAPSRFYILHSLSNLTTGQQAAVDKHDITIVVGPVNLPEYLDRPQIVTRISPSELKLAEFDKWAEPLEHNFSRVLAENLSILLSTDHIFVYPYRKGSVPIKYHVAVDVTRFDGTPGGNVTLGARWTIFGENGKKEMLLMRKSDYSEPTDGSGYEALVSAKSRALTTLSREIAEAIKAISQ